MQITEMLNSFELKSYPQVTPLNAKGIEKINAYKVNTNEGIFILKQVKRHTKDEIEKGINYSNYLNSKNLATPRGVKLKNSTNYVYEDKNNKLWILEQLMPGVHLKLNSLNQVQLTNFATTIAKIHTQGQKYTNDINKELSYLEIFDDKYLEKIQNINKTIDFKLFENNQTAKTILDYINLYTKTHIDLKQKLQKINFDNFSLGIIHRDLNNGAVLFDINSNKLTGIIDWDTVTSGYLIQDIAYLACQDMHNAKDKLYISEFIKSYSKIITLSKNEIEFIPLLEQILLTRATRWWVNYLASKQNSFQMGSITNTQMLQIENQFISTINKWRN